MNCIKVYRDTAIQYSILSHSMKICILKLNISLKLK